MAGLDRRSFLILGAAAASARAIPMGLGRAGGRRVLTLVYDKSLGMMRAIDRLVP